VTGVTPHHASSVIDSARVTLIAAPRAHGSASDEHAGSGVSQAHQPSSSTERPLRAWQRSALARYLAAAPQDFLAVATPGAGKTAFALRVASELLADRVIDAITVVTPTEHLKTQW
jgi:superfamily II DNA or RNA helicase